MRDHSGSFLGCHCQACERYYWGICFVTPSTSLDSSIFGFAQFASTLALLVIVYTIADVRYRFRIAIAPTSLFPLTYYVIGIIGFGTLFTDVWLRQRWLVPESLISQHMWQGMLAFFFLLLVMTWMYYAFIKPPVYSKKNCEKFAHELYRRILQGSEIELPVLANELSRSAGPLVELCGLSSRESRKATGKEKGAKKRRPGVAEYAHDILLMISNRKLCKHIVASSPMTAVAFFDTMAKYKKYGIPIGQFARNISTEAILNKDSLLYHEGGGHRSGLIGHIKPFSHAIYGNYALVEAFGSDYGESPLDIDYEVLRSWDAMQLEAYSRAVTLAFRSFTEDGWRQSSFALNRAFENIKSSCMDVYKLNNATSDYYFTDVCERLRCAVKFVHDAIEVIDDKDNPPSTRLRVRENSRQEDFYDRIADLMFEIIFNVAHVTTPVDTCWNIQYAAVWGEFFGPFSGGKAWKIVLFKLRRLLYDEIVRLGRFPNYKSSRILGFCLNVMGLTVIDRRAFGDAYHPLHKAVIAWTKNNYLRLRNVQPDVATSCLMGSISFDEPGARLVKTYAKGLNLEAPRDYLYLSPVDNKTTTEITSLFSTA